MKYWKGTEKWKLNLWSLIAILLTETPTTKTINKKRFEKEDVNHGKFYGVEVNPGKCFRCFSHVPDL